MSTARKVMVSGFTVKKKRRNFHEVEWFKMGVLSDHHQNWKNVIKTHFWLILEKTVNFSLRSSQQVNIASLRRTFIFFITGFFNRSFFSRLFSLKVTFFARSCNPFSRTLHWATERVCFERTAIFASHASIFSVIKVIFACLEHVAVVLSSSRNAFVST